jgi:hypothetical protein
MLLLGALPVADLHALIDIDGNPSAGLHPPASAALAARVIIRICTDTEINVVVKPVRLSITGTHIR